MQFLCFFTRVSSKNCIFHGFRVPKSIEIPWKSIQIRRSKKIAKMMHECPKWLQNRLQNGFKMGATGAFWRNAQGDPGTTGSEGKFASCLHVSLLLIYRLPPLPPTPCETSLLSLELIDWSSRVMIVTTGCYPSLRPELLALHRFSMDVGTTASVTQDAIRP